MKSIIFREYLNKILTKISSIIFSLCNFGESQLIHFNWLNFYVIIFELSVYCSSSCCIIFGALSVLQWNRNYSSKCETCNKERQAHQEHFFRKKQYNRWNFFILICWCILLKSILLLFFVIPLVIKLHKDNARNFLASIICYLVKIIIPKELKFNAKIK